MYEVTPSRYSGPQWAVFGALLSVVLSIVTGIIRAEDPLAVLAEPEHYLYALSCWFAWMAAIRFWQAWHGYAVPARPAAFLAVLVAFHEVDYLLVNVISSSITDAPDSAFSAPGFIFTFNGTVSIPVFDLLWECYFIAMTLLGAWLSVLAGGRGALAPQTNDTVPRWRGFVHWAALCFGLQQGLHLSFELARFGCAAAGSPAYYDLGRGLLLDMISLPAFFAASLFFVLWPAALRVRSVTWQILWGAGAGAVLGVVGYELLVLQAEQLVPWGDQDGFVAVAALLACVVLLAFAARWWFGRGPDKTKG